MAQYALNVREFIRSPTPHVVTRCCYEALQLLRYGHNRFAFSRFESTLTLMNTKTQRLTILLFAVGLGAQVAQAIDYVSQQRYVFGRVGSSGDLTDEQRSAPDFAPFADEVHLQYAFLSATARADVTQSSTLGATEISASASAFAIGSGSNPVGSATSRNLLNVHFTVAQPTDFRLDGSLAWQAFGSATPAIPPALWIRLNGPGGAVFDMQRGAGNIGSLSFTGSNVVTGSLGTGTYVLEAWIEGFGSRGGSASGSYNFTLNLPSPGAPIILGATALALASRRRRASH